MDIYLSAQNNRMNEIMKQLTVVATIFMPLTLISGIYGMNVVARHVASGRSRRGRSRSSSASWSLIAVVDGGYFRRKNWW